MTATNHVVAGAVVVAVVSNPVLGLPLALISHLVLDALPHYGNTNVSGRAFLYALAADAGLASAFLLCVAILQPDRWPWIIAGGVIAASPDLLWFPGWIKELRGETVNRNWLTRFLSWIQWGERPWGIIIEFFWFVLSVWLFFKIAL
jgi:hypothetical protein